MSKGTVLVTGSHGLAGSAVTARLAGQGYAVLPISHERTDLMSAEDTFEAFDRARVQIDYVYHAAAMVYGIGGNMAHQGRMIHHNTLINTNVIEAARQFGVKKVIAMGTNAIYPWPASLPYNENAIFDGRPHIMEAAYGHAKRHMLAMLEAYQDSYGMDYVYLVSGNLYGPHDRFNTETGHVLPSLVKKFYDAAQTDMGCVSVWGDGSATRDFLYSKDLARIVQMAIEEPMHGPINIGSGQTSSIDYACHCLALASGLPQDHIQFDVSKPKGRPECYADLYRLRAFGFVPEYALSRGLKETYDWYAAKRGASPVGQMDRVRV
jgi:GDP-L-fucose synthase